MKRKPSANTVQRRVARLKCVVFLTENPDVDRWFIIVPRLKLSSRSKTKRKAKK